jgi:putative transposase
MPGPYSLDLRERVVAAVGGGVSCRAAAALFRVSVSTVVKWAQRWRSTGSVAAKAMGGDNSSRLRGGDATFVLSLVAAEPDLTLEEIRERLRARGISVGYGTVWRFMDAHDLRFKKNAARQRAGQARRRRRTPALAGAARHV